MTKTSSKKVMELLNEKYRPKNEKELIAPPSIQNLFQHSFSSLPNLIFTGPNGTGKTTTAELLAEKLVGSEDYHVFNQHSYRIAGNNIYQELDEYCLLGSFTGSSYKIVILDEADCMGPTELKNIAGLIDKHGKRRRFILISNKPIDEPRLQSRCVLYTFLPINRNEIEKRLHDIVRQERLNVSSSDIRNRTLSKEGDLRKSINLLEGLQR